MEGATYRRAREDDYEAVMAIDSLKFKEFDYLPFKYQEFLKDPRRHCFVLEKEGIVVSCYHHTGF